MSENDKKDMKMDRSRILNKFKTALLVMGVTLSGSPAQAKTAEKADSEGERTEYYQENNRPSENVSTISFEEAEAMYSGAGQEYVRFASPQEEYAYNNNLRRDNHLSRMLPPNSIYEGAYVRPSNDYRIPPNVVYLPKDMEYNRGAIRTVNINYAREKCRKHKDMYDARGRFVYGPHSSYGYGYGGPTVGDVVHEVGDVVHEVGDVVHEAGRTVREVKRTVREIKEIFGGGRHHNHPGRGGR
ncbi:MAG: hypothetical protein E7005_02470 [Alphaproteobacteria bacterium]|nr:hypothetical protein [Alphaproteobacteria bacterium]